MVPFYGVPPALPPLSFNFWTCLRVRRPGSNLTLSDPTHCCIRDCGRSRTCWPGQLPYAQSNSRLAPVGELHPSRFENLAKAGDGTGTYFFASLEANDCLAGNPSSGG